MDWDSNCEHNSQLLRAGATWTQLLSKAMLRCKEPTTTAREECVPALRAVRLRCAPTQKLRPSGPPPESGANCVSAGVIRLSLRERCAREELTFGVSPGKPEQICLYLALIFSINSRKSISAAASCVRGNSSTRERSDSIALQVRGGTASG